MLQSYCSDRAGFLDLPVELRIYIYNDIFYDVPSRLRRRAVTCEFKNKTENKQPSLGLKDIDAIWKPLLGCCRQVRTEVIDLIWQKYIIRLCPSLGSHLDVVQRLPLHHVCLDVAEHDPRFTVNAGHPFAQCEAIVQVLRRVGTPRQIDMLIDASSLVAISPVGQQGRCSTHQARLAGESWTETLAHKLSHSGYCYMLARVYTLPIGSTQTSKYQVAGRLSDSENPNDSVQTVYHDELESCDQLACRLLYAIGKAGGGGGPHPLNYLMERIWDSIDWEGHSLHWWPEKNSDEPLILSAYDCADVLRKEHEFLRPADLTISVRYR